MGRRLRRRIVGPPEEEGGGIHPSSVELEEQSFWRFFGGGMKDRLPWRRRD